MAKSDAAKEAQKTAEIVETVELTKDEAYALQLGLAAYQKDPGAVAANGVFFKLRRFSKELTALIEEDVADNEAWKKTISSRQEELRAKYVDLDAAGKPIIGEDGNYKLSDPVKKADGEKAFAELRKVLDAEANDMEKKFAAKVEISGYSFTESDVPEKMPNAAKTVFVDHFVK